MRKMGSVEVEEMRWRHGQYSYEVEIEVDTTSLAYRTMTESPCIGALLLDSGLRDAHSADYSITMGKHQSNHLSWSTQPQPLTCNPLIE